MKPSMRLFTIVATGYAIAATVHADEVTDWNQIFLQANITAGTDPVLSGRLAAIVQGAVFDATNGIEREYSPIHVPLDGPPGGSIRAAAVQAAYTTLVAIFPAQKSMLDANLASSLAAIASSESKNATRRGIDWGRTVAESILQWRSTDGFSPPPPNYSGGSEPGQWRPTPSAFAFGLRPQFATMTPWVIKTPSQFRPAGPPRLNSFRYTADFNETKTMGSAASSIRTPDQTVYARFWNSAPATYLWNRVAVSLAKERNLTLSENARLLAMLNLAIADGTIACWDAKYTYSFWRPVSAIPLADTDGNPDTDPDFGWTPLIISPPHPEYPSAHSTLSAAALNVLAIFFGEITSFTVESYGMPGVTRSFTDFSSPAAEIKNARIFAGIHFRSSCNDGVSLGVAVAEYVLDHSMRLRHPER